MSWYLTSQIASDLIQNKQTKAKLSGDVIILEKPILISKHFEEEIDLTDHIKQFIVQEVQDAIQEAVNTISDTLNEAVDTVKEGAKKIVDGIKGWFN
jgi:hypothetical protein